LERHASVVRAFVLDGTNFSEADSEGADAVEPMNSQAHIAHVAARAIVLIQADNPAIAWWLSSPSAWWSVVVPDRCRRRARTPLGRGRRTRLFPVRRLAALPGSQPGVISEFALGAVPQPGASVVRVRSDSPPSSPGLNIASPGAFRA